MGIQHILKTVKYNDEVVIVDDDLLKKIHSSLILMMKDIVRVFNEEGIEWYLSGGSVLGSVRHSGFIPWDDDIDIFMKRDAFNKLLKIFDKKLGDKYTIKLPGDKDYVLNLPQIQKKGTKLIPLQSTKDEEDGLFIDFFILENTYDNLLLRGIHGLISTGFLFICSSMRMDRCQYNILKYTDNNASIKKEIKKRAGFSFLFKYMSLEQWLKVADKWFSIVKKKTNYLVCPSGAKHFFGELYKKELFGVPETGQFCNERWNLPSDAKAYLQLRYGSDYMVIPKSKDREKHVYIKLELED